MKAGKVVSLLVELRWMVSCRTLPDYLVTHSQCYEITATWIANASPWAIEPDVKGAVVDA